MKHTRGSHKTLSLLYTLSLNYRDTLHMLQLRCHVPLVMYSLDINLRTSNKYSLSIPDILGNVPVKFLFPVLRVYLSGNCVIGKSLPVINCLKCNIILVKAGMRITPLNVAYLYMYDISNCASVLLTMSSVDLTQFIVSGLIPTGVMYSFRRVTRRFSSAKMKCSI